MDRNKADGSGALMMFASADRQLVEAAQKGDGSSLEALLARHEKQVYRFSLKMCRHPEDAQDVLQDTLLAVARNLRDFRGASSISTWLYTIAHSFCVKKRRRSKFAPKQEQSLDSGPAAEVRQIADPQRPADETLAGRQIEAALDSAIRSLEPKYREVLLLRDVEGLTAPEVAKVIGIGVDAVKSRLHRARVAVRERVAPALGVIEPSAPPKPLSEACPDILQLFSRHLEGEISSDVCAELEKHLASCEGCQGRCDSLRKTLAFCRQTPAPEVPAPVQDSVRKALRLLLERND